MFRPGWLNRPPGSVAVCEQHGTGTRFMIILYRGAAWVSSLVIWIGAHHLALWWCQLVAVLYTTRRSVGIWGQFELWQRLGDGIGIGTGIGNVILKGVIGAEESVLFCRSIEQSKLESYFGFSGDIFWKVVEPKFEEYFWRPVVYTGKFSEVVLFSTF